MIKRAMDIILSGIALIILLPLFPPIALILKLTGEGEVFYTQQRVGIDGKTFDLIKFATMLKDSPNMQGGEVTLVNDPRVLPIGRFLRKTKINELPQLINIIKGDMSIVGPRPLIPVSFNQYPDEIKSEIISLQPGLTGIGSIVFRDEECITANSCKPALQCYCEDILPYKGKLEIWYKEHQSFWVDIALILITAWAVVSPATRIYEKLLKDLPERPQNLETSTKSQHVKNS